MSIRPIGSSSIKFNYTPRDLEASPTEFFPTFKRNNTLSDDVVQFMITERTRAKSFRDRMMVSLRELKKDVENFVDRI